MRNHSIDQSKKLDAALAALIASTLTKKRPISLVEAAEWLTVAVEALGSIQSVADRLGISAKMLKQFSAINKLAPETKSLFEKRQIDSVDAAVHLSQLSKDDQITVAVALSNGEIDTSDVRAVVQSRKQRLNTKIESIIKSIKTSKTTKEYVVEFAIKGTPDKQLIRRCFDRFFPPGTISTVEVDGMLGRLVLTPHGKKHLSHLAKSLGIPAKYVVSHILK